MRAVALALSLLVLPTGALAEVLTVARDGSGDHRSIARAVAASEHGDTIRILPGTYSAVDVSIPHDLTIEGGVIITADMQVAKGFLVPLGGTAVTVRNVTFEGARSPDLNGAGIRFEGSSLVVEDATFRDNENGILATGDEAGMVSVSRSLFENSGHGDGYSHGLYLSSGKSLTVRDSRFVGTKVGHHVKSLASMTGVIGNTFDDAGGETSYVVDATAGGRLIIMRNEILRRQSAGQQTLFNYDATRGGEPIEIVIEDNVIVTERPSTRLLRNPEGAELRMEGNTFTAKGRGEFVDMPRG